MFPFLLIKTFVKEKLVKANPIARLKLETKKSRPRGPFCVGKCKVEVPPS